MEAIVCVKNFIFFLFLNQISTTSACENIFEGFGVYLGSANHFSQSAPGTVKSVLAKVYSDLGIRHYRTSYESSFSPAPDVYDISCQNNFTCSWIEIHKEMSKYPDISIIASIWSPPHYMKNNESDFLHIQSEGAYLHFIRNITQLIKSNYNLTIERVSPVNEPENVFASWEHTNMLPEQLCRMVKDFNDTLVSICPENSYYWISELYGNYSNITSGVDCRSTCEIFGTHAYDLNIDLGSSDNFKAYYDLKVQDRNITKPIWVTEVSSTFGQSESTQIQEALDFSTNIVNFVGHTCIQRYYYWNSFTQGSSGESLIWGNDEGGLTFPKKYHAYKHFTLASSGGPKQVTKCESNNIDGISCLKFGEINAVFVNKLNTTAFASSIDARSLQKCGGGTLCCTTDTYDWHCDSDEKTLALPPRSICSCKMSGIPMTNSALVFGKTNYTAQYAFSFYLTPIILIVLRFIFSLV